MKKRFPIVKWIMLALAIICNGFIIIYSCLSEETTGKWNRTFTNFFTQIINNITQKEAKHIPLENICISFSNEADHKYNYLPNYELNEIPLGSAKQIECAFLPVDATNKSITYSVEPSYIATLNQSGSTSNRMRRKCRINRNSFGIRFCYCCNGIFNW